MKKRRRPSLLDSRAKAGIAIAALGGVALLAYALGDGEPTRLDRAARRAVRRPGFSRARTIMRPLYPIGLPGGYITIAYLTAHWLRRSRRGGGPAIVTSAWAGWLVHRAFKLVYTRERPRIRGRRRRTDSYPSGHTTGATALSLTTAYVLYREGAVSSSTATLLALGAPAVMGAYRVLAEDHWATDVFGGWMLGASVAAACV